MRSSIALFLCVLLGGCGFVHDEKIDGPYRLIAIDTIDQMSLCCSLPGGDAIGRVDETVFAVGYDKNYIVAKRHPDADKSITQFYYLIRAADSQFADPQDSVHGPFTFEQFEQERVKLALPAFTRVIRELE